jgi:hypothetical protein
VLGCRSNVRWTIAVHSGKRARLGNLGTPPPKPAQSVRFTRAASAVTAVDTAARWIQKRAPEQLELTIEATRNSVLVLAAAQPQHRVRDRRALVCLTRLVEQRLRNMRDRNAAQIDETWLDSSRQAGPARRSVSSAVPAEAK